MKCFFAVTAITAALTVGCGGSNTSAEIESRAIDTVTPTVGNTSLQPSSTQSTLDPAERTSDEPAAADVAFEGGAVDLPRTFRYGFLDVEIVSAEVVDDHTAIRLNVHNRTEAKLSGLRSGLFRLLQADGTLANLDLVGEEIAFGVEANGTTTVDLVGDAIDLTTSALQIDDRRDQPAVVAFGGPEPEEFVVPLASGASANSVINDCDTQVRTTIVDASVVLDRDAASGILSTGLGRADTDSRYLRLVLELEQLSTCDRTVTILSFDLAADDLDVSGLSRVDLDPQAPETATVFVTFPTGTEAVSLRLGSGDSLTIDVSEAN